MSDKQLVIALRLPDVQPTELSMSEMAELLKQFSALFKGTEATFTYIKSGSSYFGGSVCDSSLPIVKANIEASIDGDLDKLISRHCNWGHADIGIHNLGEEPKNMTVLRSIENNIKKPEKFKQIDTLRGSVRKFNDGEDGLHQIGIRFLNGKTITAKASKEVAIALSGFYSTGILIDFTGQATYSISNDFQMILEDFKIDSFEKLPPDTLEQWVDDFTGYGESGWQSVDQPFELLKKERFI